MRTISKIIPVMIVLSFIGVSSLAGDKATKPVTPKASPEAASLLELFYGISGKYTLAGQHNYPNTRDRNSRFAARYIGQTPAVWSTDMGFAEDGDTDSYLARPDIVQEAIRQHRLGSIITLCWHAVPPTADEPVSFNSRPGMKVVPESLATVQGQLLDSQFQDVLTPGTRLHERWCAQVDSVAFYLKKLRDAHVPVMWRPYHEMNGGWFWWGGRLGEYSTRALYRQLFDRYTKVHKLDNLIWVWSVDRPNKPEMRFSNYFPGKDYLDVVALDVYGSDFNPAYYDSLVALSAGKPLVLGEVGNPPTPEILNSQPKWSYWVVWAGMARNTSKKQYEALTADPRVLFQEDSAYIAEMAPYRAACKLPPLPIAKSIQTDLPGEWLFDEEKSVLDDWGASNQAYKMEIVQDGNDLAIARHFIVEWGGDRITEDSLTTDGKEYKSEFWNSPRITTAKFSEAGDALIIESKVTFNRDGQISEMVTTETWSFSDQGKVLSIAQISTGFRGERKAVLVYHRQ